MDPETERLVRERACALWEADGRPEGRDLDYWLQAEEEIGALSVAGEEDPLAAVDDLPPGFAKPKASDAARLSCCLYSYTIARWPGGSTSANCTNEPGSRIGLRPGRRAARR